MILCLLLAEGAQKRAKKSVEAKEKEAEKEGAKEVIVATADSATA